ncbi:hypothetical protein OKJ48_23110 [Streptomyces kunmingensis]|uniref:Uncharacterized protein n=1 Tax=Streptomyces kunmingensis TaxID=68225 RepID=A0ABU6CEH7_9ACTN|nr:DUF6573 family protein [Streptomyces kunmingensis]MEB3963115.1 hypothetical protein [Streptomyces kunmingensis]
MTHHEYTPEQAAADGVYVAHPLTRAQAIAHGLFVEAPRTLSHEAGFRVPVALTKAAWEDCVAWTDADDQQQHTVQDETGRLWDVLLMSRLAIARSKGIHAHVTLHRIKRDGTSRTPQLARLVIEIGPGDQAEPVITIMLPYEG